MKGLSLCTFTAICLLSAVQFTACKRENAKKGEPVCPCQVKKIVQKIPGMQDRSGIFTYDSSGYPTGFVPEKYNTGSVRYEFRYDDNRRLTDYIGYYPSNNPALSPFFEFWTKYTYDNSGRVIKDTTYLYGAYGPQLITYHAYKNVTVYEYDNQQRISRTVKRQLLNDVPNGVIADYKFDYNPEGNLVTPGALYDNKLSVYRTNKIWMFLNRNYSANNLLQGTSYNTFGLPLGFGRNPAQGPYLGMLYFLGFNDCEIEYECK